ncbi:MAG: site-2 protease family protein [Acidimicrobiales bacterium]
MAVYPQANRQPARTPVRPSPVFLVVLAAFGLGVWLCLALPVSARIACFVLVTSGWVLSLILHEFAHALVAYRGGDRSTAEKGYLSLDPRLYTDPLTSLALPMLFIIMGGIGLPGGAVWINRAALRSPAVETAVSLAGPAVNALFAAACLVPIGSGLLDIDTPTLTSAVAFLGFLQVTAVVLNLLPVPGLDGFGAIEPYLPRSVLNAVAGVRPVAMLILIGVMFYVEPVRNLFWDANLGILKAFGVNQAWVSEGWSLFRFWV